MSGVAVRYLQPPTNSCGGLSGHRCPRSLKGLGIGGAICAGGLV